MALANGSGEPERIMIDATHLKAQRTAASLVQKGLSRLFRVEKGGLNSKLHAVCDEAGKLILLYLTAGQVGDHKGAHALLPVLPQLAC